MPPGPPCLGLKRELVQGQCQREEEKRAQHFPQPDVVSPGHKIKRLRRNMKRCIDFSRWFFYLLPSSRSRWTPQPGAGGASLGAPVGCITARGYRGDVGEFLVLCRRPGSDPKPARGAAALHSLRLPPLGRLLGATHVPEPQMSPCPADPSGAGGGRQPRSLSWGASENAPVPSPTSSPFLAR